MAMTTSNSISVKPSVRFPSSEGSLFEEVCILTGRFYTVRFFFSTIILIILACVLPIKTLFHAGTPYINETPSAGYAPYAGGGYRMQSPMGHGAVRGCARIGPQPKPSCQRLRGHS
jgi:hypothetical protein